MPHPGQPFPCKAIHEMPEDTYECWSPGRVFVIDGNTNEVVSSFLAGSDPEGVVFAPATQMVYASNEDDGTMTVAKGAVRSADGSITPPHVLSTIIRGRAVPGTWEPICDANNYCGVQGESALWPKVSACGADADEADKMTVDPLGNVYIIDDRYRVGKVKAGNGCSSGCGAVEKVLEIEGYECPAPEGPAGSPEVFSRNTANNIAFSAPDPADPTTWRLYVISEQNTFAEIDPVAMEIRQIIAIPDAMHLDAATADPALNRLYITDEGKATLWILQGACVSGNADACVQPNEPADFVFAAASGSQTVNAGQSAQFGLSIETSPTFSGNVTLACSAGLPRGTTCSFSPASVNPGANGSATVVMTVSTTPRQTASARSLILVAGARSPLPPRGVLYATLLPMVGLVLGGFGMTRRQRLAVLLTLLALLLVLALVGCGGGSTPAPAQPAPIIPSINPDTTSTPAGTYTVTVSATSATASHTANVTVTVN